MKLLSSLKKREKKIEEVVVKTKEKKMLNQLEETHKENFNRETNALELKFFDEVAVQNFNKAKNETRNNLRRNIPLCICYCNGVIDLYEFNLRKHFSI